MTQTLADVARATGLEMVGDGTLPIGRPAAPADAGPEDLALAMSDSYAAALGASQARAGVVWADADWASLGLEGALLAPRARVALARITVTFQHPHGVAEGIHPTAIIDPTAEIGDGAAIGPYSLIGARARVGDNAVIGAHCSIGEDAVLGDRPVLHPGVRIGARCTIGRDFIAQPNAVIGADGFSFEPPERGNVEAAKTQTSLDTAQQTSGYLRIHSLAAVEIGDDVEIGAATTIDRGTIAPTRIGSGTKIDNQVQIGHNVQIGQMCLLCAQVGIAGSATLGDRVVLGGKAGVADHVEIGSDVVCAAASSMASRVPSKSVMMGTPAVDRRTATDQFLAIRRLPQVVAQVREIRKKLGL
ncbi:MAG: UDP-3-O-(3-hydroxymyristoyl)glucosamine N-acyltransferase [Pseudomonadota bacterium]